MFAEQDRRKCGCVWERCWRGCGDCHLHQSTGHQVSTKEKVVTLTLLFCLPMLYLCCRNKCNQVVEDLCMKLDVYIELWKLCQKSYCNKKLERNFWKFYQVSTKFFEEKLSHLHYCSFSQYVIFAIEITKLLEEIHAWN